MSLGIVHECSFPERPEDGFGSSDSEVTKHQTWMLGTERRSSIRAECALNH